LNYQGAGLNPVLRSPGTPQYPLYHEAYPNKFIVGTETASTVSSRGFYAFPVATGMGTAAAAKLSAPVPHPTSRTASPCSTRPKATSAGASRRLHRPMKRS